MNRLLPILSLLLLLTGCFGLKTEKFLCKNEALADVTGFPGSITIAAKTGNLRGLVERLDKGIYLIREEHPLPSREDPFLALRVCRLGKDIFAEYQHYDIKSRKLSERSFWPQKVELKNGRFHFYLVDTSIVDLDRHGIPYALFPQKLLHQARGFIVANNHLNIDLNLAKILSRIEETPNTVIDFPSRHIYSPLFGR